MICYYCWTDTLLVNALKLKTGPMKEEKGDLYVLTLPRLSLPLVESIKALKCFQNIYLIDPPKDLLPGPAGKGLKLLIYSYYYQALRRQLPSPLPHYDRMISGGLWSYTIPLRDLLADESGKLPITLLDEGTAVYGGSLTAYWCDPKSRFRDRLFRRLFYRSSYDRATRSLEDVYLLRPDACLAPGNLKIKLLPFRTEAYEKLMDSVIREEDIAPYQDRKVSVYLQPESEADNRKTLAIIQALANRYGPEQLVVRPHPDSRTSWDSSSIDPAIIVDRKAVSFDCIFPQVDWSDKTMVSRASSCLFYPLFGLHQQPIIYFVYSMFSNGDEFLIQMLSTRIRELYSDPDRVRIPSDLESFKAMLAG